MGGFGVCKHSCQDNFSLRALSQQLQGAEHTDISLLGSFRRASSLDQLMETSTTASSQWEMEVSKASSAQEGDQPVIPDIQGSRSTGIVSACEPDVCIL